MTKIGATVPDPYLRPAADTTIDPEELADLCTRLRAPDCPREGVVGLGRWELEYRDPRAFATTVELLFRDGVYDVDGLARPAVVLDGGSWLGLSVLRFRSLFPDALIRAFEPDPELFEVLTRNLERNGVGNVELHNVALADQEGELEFLATGNDAGSLRVRSPRGRLTTVPARVPSAYVTAPLSLLKLNVEGSEWDVIDELGDRLGLVDQLLIEYHGFGDLPQTLHRILGRLHEHGFTYIVSHFNERNRACVPPLRLTADFRYFLLIYARQLGAGE
ncbi:MULTISPECIES: FkbM family methyltransferase [unclassified Streptomyces]|uniref:FkbM family methyltransferase n=1 Tax=unclassified Streptomyces TaxID=2593676 RepID=UPI002DDB2A22|nr:MULTISPECIES: FkbM family methyltransferase [unclassified Streptomyces]WSA94664.1 FkbM family methyltransferase [Streptomyces sp. NBC_01795]WSB79083.1 FkbM family methyltransferase [Streptomyces sp. NBC_01775]WSS12716.1 FkbM family methyltransferase [Streptomyces sp. NBC_01186]WSS41499.1 FkbM family methyltransferase [Streptomyces sp. NBC_01187]